MSNWLSNLPVFPAMTAAVFGSVFLVCAALFLLVTRLAVGERIRTFKAIAPVILPTLGPIFAFLLLFIAQPVWTNHMIAQQSVASEASALRDVLLIARGMPADTESTLRAMIGKYVDQVTNKEWLAMASNSVAEETNSSCECSPELTDALGYARGLKLGDDTQRAGQREIVSGLEEVRKARRTRILLSEDGVGSVKSIGLGLIGLCLLTVVALLHSDNRRACVITLTIFGVVVSVLSLLIMAYSSPFGGSYSIGPQLLAEVMQDIPAHAPPN